MINKQIVNDKGEVVGSKKVNPKMDPSAKDTPFKIQQKDVKASEFKTELDPEVKNEVKPEVKNEVKPEVKNEVKPEVKNEVKPEVKPEVKKMHPIEKKNRARFGDARVDMLKAKNIDFKAMRKGDMTKDAFIKKYPKSITAQRASGLRDEYEPYDLVLGYVLTEGHADTVEEAHYVMTQMDEETIKAIINEIDNLGGYGAIGGILGAGAVLTNPIINAVKSGTKLIKGIRDKQNKSLEKLKP
jgi:hypothetical protein